VHLVQFVFAFNTTRLISNDGRTSMRTCTRVSAVVLSLVIFHAETALATTNCDSQYRRCTDECTQLFPGRSWTQCVYYQCAGKSTKCIAGPTDSKKSRSEPPTEETTVKAQGRVKIEGKSTSASTQSICDLAKRARERNSPAAPGLEAKCAAAGGN
jgi:hypothetical protein